MIAVVGTGGTGATTVALGLARAQASAGGAVVVDLGRDGGVAGHLGLAGARPGLPEALRGRRPLPTVAVGAGLRALTGLRDPADWTVTPATEQVASVLDALEDLAGEVVCDLGAELEGAERTGAFDVEERHRLARIGAQRADAVVVVVAPGEAGARRAAHLGRDLDDLGVDARRTVYVLNRVPRRAAATGARTLERHLGDVGVHAGAVVAVGDRRRRPLGRRSAAAAPSTGDVRRILAAVRRVAAASGRPARPDDGFRIRPGELGLA